MKHAVVQRPVFCLRYGLAFGVALLIAGETATAAESRSRVGQGLVVIAPTDSWYPASIFFQGMKFMLFGDPSLRMPPPEKRP